MGTTTSTPDQTQSDVGAILGGMNRGASMLPPQLRSTYTPLVPTALQPPAPPATTPTPSTTPPSSQPYQPPGATQPIALPTQPRTDTTVPLVPAPQQVASIQTDLLKDPTGRNNPGNIRIPGATGSAGFQSFPTMQAGLQALQNNLLSYQDQHGLNTIEGIISRWSPSNENPTEELIKKASASMGIDRKQRIDLHDPATMTKMTNVILAQEQDKASNGPNGMRLPQPQQHMLTPERRDAPDWGHPPPVSGAMPETRPQQSDFSRIMGYVAPALMAIGSLALRLPLSTAVMAYSSMARAQANGQREEYERNRTKYQDKLNESNAQQALESKDASDAFDTYGHNNPQGLQQRLMQIAMTYNDPILYTTAARGDLNGAYKLQADRDLHNQSLSKVNDAVRKQQDEQAQDAAVKAMDDQWHDEFVKTNGREPTADETAIAHNQHIGEAGRAGTKDPKGAGTGSQTQGPTYRVIDKDGKPTDQLVVRNKSGIGWVDPNTGKPVVMKPGDVPEPLSSKASQPAPTNPYVQPGQQTPGDVTPDQTKPDQSDQTQPDRPDQTQGAAPQAPAGPVQTAAAPVGRPYQIAQAGPGVPPPPSRTAPAAPGMGPNMSRLNEDGRRLARDYATNGNEALQDVPAAFRMPLVNAGQELRGEMQDAAQSGLTGDALDKRLHQIDPTYADYLKGVSTYANDLPTPGRTGASSGRIMALSIANKLNPNFSEQKLKAQENFRQPGGQVQRTLSRAAIMAESGKQVREYLKALPDDPNLERWQRAWTQFKNNQLVGDHRYSDVFVALRQYIQEANVLVRGGQESVTETGEQLGTRDGGGLFGTAPFAMGGNATPGMILGLLKTDARNVMARMNNFRNQWRQQDGHGEMPGEDTDAYKTFEEFSGMDVDKEAGMSNSSDIDKFLKQ